MKNKRLPIGVIAVLLVAGGAWYASLRVPTGPAAGVEVRGRFVNGAAESGTIRVGTFNIHGCKGRDRRRDVDRVAECLRGLDFVALSEVRSNRFWRPQDQAEMLAGRLGRAWLFAPASRRWFHRDFGNGLLTALPVRFWQRIPLPSDYDNSYRNVLLVGLEHQDCTIHVLITHLTRRDDRARRAQLQAVIELFLALAEPAILAGDLNSSADDPQIRRLLGFPGVVDSVGEFLGPKYSRKIDWIFARGFRSIDGGVRDNGASDHPLFWAELELIPRAVKGRQAPAGGGVGVRAE